MLEQIKDEIKTTVTGAAWQVRDAAIGLVGDDRTYQFLITLN